jgi:L-aspartate oxidase
VKSSSQHERIETDFIVIGGGVAGLRAAVDLAKAGRVLLLTKTALTESNSQYAQGGIAAPAFISPILSQPEPVFAMKLP